MSKTEKQKLGVKGEDLACRYLEQKGHTILRRNFRFNKSELDIISRFDDTLVVSEVKSYFKPPLGAAEFRITKSKRKQVIAGTYGFLSRFNEFAGLGVRFDVLIVDFSNYPAGVTHYEGAFWDEEGW